MEDEHLARATMASLLPEMTRADWAVMHHLYLHVNPWYEETDTFNLKELVGIVRSKTDPECLEKLANTLKVLCAHNVVVRMGEGQWRVVSRLSLAEYLQRYLPERIEKKLSADNILNSLKNPRR